MPRSKPRTVPDDWYPGDLPANVLLGEGCTLDTTYSLRRFFSRRRPGLVIGAHGGIYGNTIFVVGTRGQVRIGDHALLSNVYIACEHEIRIGRRVMIAWNTALLDACALPPRVPGAAEQRTAHLRAAARDPHGRMLPFGEARPVILEDDVWIGFGAIVLPGVRVGEGSIIGARSVVTNDVPAGVVAAGNPARVLRVLRSEDRTPAAADRQTAASRSGTTK